MTFQNEQEITQKPMTHLHITLRIHLNGMTHVTSCISCGLKYVQQVDRVLEIDRAV